MAPHMKITAIDGPVTVMAGSIALGTSVHALDLHEGSYGPVLYIPRSDIDMARLERTERVTTCPHKGRANYYSIITPQGRLDNAVWTYETPLDPVGAIAGHLAFYPDKVRVTRG